jgi:signal transduction histidine kinase
MASVSWTAERRGGWPGRLRRMATGPRGPVLAGAVLGLLAVAETVSRAQISRTAVVGGHVTSTVSPGGNPQSLWVLTVLCLFTTLPLAFLRPAAAAVAVTAASVLSLALFQTLTVAGAVAQLIVLYRLGRTGPPVLAVALAVPFPILALTGPAGTETPVLTVLLASLGPAAALAGIARRARAEATEQSAASEAIAGSLTEHLARGERARIARELHDVVAHHISMVAVQAETARLTTAGMPAAGAQRLLAIGDTARAALTEMRRLLGVLREDADAEPAIRQPQPGLRQLNELIDVARDASGAGTRLILRGAPAALDSGVELAAYRIIQEALTNARRHAPGAAVDVELHYEGPVLRVRIRDNGPGLSPGAQLASGHGLAGMRERAAAVGGDLRTGPAVGGGFLVEATLPAVAEAVA